MAAIAITIFYELVLREMGGLHVNGIPEYRGYARSNEYKPMLDDYIST